MLHPLRKVRNLKQRPPCVCQHVSAMTRGATIWCISCHGQSSASPDDPGRVIALDQNQECGLQQQSAAGGVNALGL